MRSRLTVFGVAVLMGGLVGSLWNFPVFGAIYKGILALFMDPAAPLGAASAAVVLSFP